MVLLNLTFSLLFVGFIYLSRFIGGIISGEGGGKFLFRLFLFSSHVCKLLVELIFCWFYVNNEIILLLREAGPSTMIQ